MSLINTNVVTTNGFVNRKFLWYLKYFSQFHNSFLVLLWIYMGFIGWLYSKETATPVGVTQVIPV